MKSLKFSILLSLLYMLLILAHMDLSMAVPSLFGMVIFLMCLVGTLMRSLKASILLAFFYILFAFTHLDSPMTVPEEAVPSIHEALITHYTNLNKQTN